MTEKNKQPDEKEQSIYVEAGDIEGKKKAIQQHKDRLNENIFEYVQRKNWGF